MNDVRLGATLATLVLSFFACSQEVKVTPDPTTASNAANVASSGATSGPTSTSSAQGASSSGAGGAGGSTSTAVTVTVSTGVGGGMSCCGPVQVAGTVKTVTADSDPAQFVGVTVVGGSNLPIAAGPLFLTGVTGYGFGTLYSVVGVDCTAPQQTPLLSTLQPITGFRIFIPMGQTLCASNFSNTGYVSGFRPY